MCGYNIIGGDDVMLKWLFVLLITGTIMVARIPSAIAAPNGGFKISSTTFKNGATLALAQVYTAGGGGNVSPELHWSGAPASTKSFVVTCFDPDARHGLGWWHWVQLDIPPLTKELPVRAGELLKGIVDEPTGAYGQTSILNSFGDQGYDGPFPPIGDPPHHYVFTVYAMNVSILDVNNQESLSQIKAHILAHSIAQASITGRYGR
jgi:Raf kinase inhibitor-like YbhB/YbcL family protein